MSSHPIVPRRARRRPIPPEEAFAQWLARAVMRDTEQGSVAEVTLAHGRLGQRHALPLESFDVDPESVSVESAVRLATDIWSAAEAHAANFKGPQRYDVTALYGSSREALAQTSFRLHDEDEQSGDVIEGVIEQPNANGWLAQTMRHRESEARAVRSLLQETLAVIRAAGEMTRDVGALAHAEVEKERIRAEEAERVRRFQMEQEDRAEKRRIEEEERSRRHAIELKTTEARATAELTSLETKQKAIEQSVDLLKIFAPMAAHRVVTHFGGGPLPATENELFTAARVRGFLQTLDPADVAKVTDALGGSSPKAIGFLDLVSSVLFNASATGKTSGGASGTAASSATAANDSSTPVSGEPSTTSAASDEPAPSPLAQTFIQALRQAFAAPRSDAELAVVRAGIRQQLANQHALADVEAVARFVERAGYTQIADLFQEHLRARRADS